MYKILNFFLNYNLKPSYQVFLYFFWKFHLLNFLWIQKFSSNSKLFSTVSKKNIYIMLKGHDREREN